MAWPQCTSTHIRAMGGCTIMATHAMRATHAILGAGAILATRMILATRTMGAP